MKNILLLINSNARSGAGAYQSISNSLKDAGHHVIDLSPSELKQDYRELVKRYQDEVDLIIVGGGDGSINYILPTLIESKIPLIVHPLGTANVLARSFNIKADITELINLIETGSVVDIDLGSVNGIYFINVCGMGISTEVNGQVSKKLKRLTGALSFFLTGLKLIRRLKPSSIKITIDENPPIVTRTWQITVCNGRKYGAWMTIEPDASYDDGILHCLSTEVKKTWQGFKLLPSYVKGTYKEHHDVNLLKGKRIKIESKRPLKIDVDGDIQTTTPAVFQVHSRILKLVVPAKALYDSSPVQTCKDEYTSLTDSGL